MLTKGITKRVELPHEPGAWIEVKLLGYRQLEAAKQKRLFDQIRIFRELGPQLPTGGVTIDPDAPVAPIIADPLNTYDQGTLLEAAIVAWSYDAKVTVDAIQSLDEQTAEYVARQVVLKPESDEDRKNA